MELIFEILFLVGYPGKISKGKKPSKGKSNLLYLRNGRSHKAQIW